MTSRRRQSSRDHSISKRRVSNEERQETSKRRASSTTLGRTTNGDQTQYHGSRQKRVVFAKEQSHMDDSSNSESSTIPLEDILKKTWKIYRVSPLFDFKYKTDKLRHYGQHLQNSLKNSKIDSKTNIQYLVKFTIKNDLRWTDLDQEAVQIEVKGVIDGREPHILYLGLLLSWGKTQQFTTKHFVHLPILLQMGAVPTANSVHDLLQKMFDCCINPLEFSEDDLFWLSAITNIHTYRTYKTPVSLHYKCPQLSGVGKIMVTMPVDKVQKLWKRIHDQTQSKVTYEEVTLFHNCLFDQQKLVHSLESTSLILYMFEFPTMSLSLEGKVKLRHLEAAEYALSYFCSAACILDSASPSLSVTVIN